MNPDGLTKHDIEKSRLLNSHRIHLTSSRDLALSVRVSKRSITIVLRD